MDNKTAELIKKVRKIEIKTNRLSSQVFSGEYHSSFKGRGMTFDEVREYQYGDDIRTIDWNVTARTGSPHIKVFQEERELTLMLMVDVSASTMFGTRVQRKADMITEICATLAFSAIQNNDKVGLILYANKVESFIPPEKGRKHILRIIRELIEHKVETKKTNLDNALQYAGSILKRSSILFIISDFYEDNYKRSLGIIAKRHDVTGIKIYDEKERILPKVGLLPVRDLETGKELWINTRNTRVRASQTAHFIRSTKKFEENFMLSGAGTITCETDESYTKKLMGYFNNRVKR